MEEPITIDVLVHPFWSDFGKKQFPCQKSEEKTRLWKEEIQKLRPHQHLIFVRGDNYPKEDEEISHMVCPHLNEVLGYIENLIEFSQSRLGNHVIFCQNKIKREHINHLRNFNISAIRGYGEHLGYCVEIETFRAARYLNVEKNRIAIIEDLSVRV